MNTGGKKKKRNVAAACESFEGVERIGREKGNREQRLLLGTMERTRLYMRTSMWYGSSGEKDGFLRLLSGEEAHDDRWDPCVCATHAVSTSLFPLPSSLSLSLSYTRRSLVRRYSTRIAGEPCGRYVARARSAHARARRACLVLYVTCYGRPVPLAKA